MFQQRDLAFLLHQGSKCTWQCIACDTVHFVTSITLGKQDSQIMLKWASHSCGKANPKQWDSVSTQQVTIFMSSNLMYFSKPSTHPKGGKYSKLYLLHKINKLKLIGANTSKGALEFIKYIRNFSLPTVSMLHCITMAYCNKVDLSNCSLA